MTLAEVLKHVFTEEDLIKEVTDYKVTHTTTNNYVIDTDNKLSIQVIKPQKGFDK